MRKQFIVALLCVCLMVSCSINHEHDYTYNVNLQQCECGEVNPLATVYVGTDFDHATRRFVSVQGALVYSNSQPANARPVIKLNDDTSSEGINIQYAATIDLCGHKLTFSGAYGLTVNASSNTVSISNGTLEGPSDIVLVDIRSGKLQSSVCFSGKMKIGSYATFQMEGGNVLLQDVTLEQGAPQILLKGGTMTLASSTLVGKVNGRIGYESERVPEVANHTHNFVMRPFVSSNQSFTSDSKHWFDCTCGYLRCTSHQWNGDNCTVCGFNTHYSISNYNFYQPTTGLEGDIVIPDGVKSINSNTLAFNTAITSIVLPASLTNIGSQALMGCTGLESVVFKGTSEQWSQVQLGNQWNHLCTFGQVTCLGDSVQ